ncbi:bile acid:sodium symporter family protein [Corallococcus praedator]|uniref:Bile acid:sodium symporter family protein n=1 Tax=Corallococcus praedator TaxID=2316724 RepID=A0ABX9QN14_9BACT|nr:MULTISPECIES: bile acid:sodium symporter family protein [Corallococcus]RKH18268.1 bile acid:sodium symporter family protein [Corallococcus sp. CA047B]RKH32853.1 bile acid:sodium symporter family protein [Corallococcus sp. CA031C]RKI11927.1 bile acid:sodium symporter family protein [Corallococcus praedator]
MQTSVITEVFLPIALGVIMLGLGLSLSLADFRRVAQFPRAALVGLGCQTLLMPVVCYGIAVGFGLPPQLAVGLMLLAASPGGATANLFSHLAKGDVALNVSLTAVNSVLSLFTLPLIVNFSLLHFMGEERAIPLQFAKIVQVFGIVLVPISLGMWVRAKWPALADRLDRPVRIMSALFLVLVVAAAIIKERAQLVTYFQSVGLAALAFNLASMAVGFVVPMLLRIERKQAVAIAMEVGIHNGTLAIAIASSPRLLNDGVMAIPAAIYSVIMFFTAGVFGALVARRQAASVAAVSPR